MVVLTISTTELCSRGVFKDDGTEEVLGSVENACTPEIGEVGGIFETAEVSCTLETTGATGVLKTEVLDAGSVSGIDGVTRLAGALDVGVRLGEADIALLVTGLSLGRFEASVARTLVRCDTSCCVEVGRSIGLLEVEEATGICKVGL